MGLRLAKTKGRPTCANRYARLPNRIENYAYKSRKAKLGPVSGEQSIPAVQSALLGRGPDGKAESNFVHEIRQVVHQIQDVVLDAAHEVPEEVAQRVNRPTNGDNEAHRLE